MVASNVVWNLTVPDTSPMIQYRNFARDCPLNNGVLQCTTDSAHVSNATDSSITISFFGTAIYLFGDVDGGTTYTTSLDYAPAVDGAVKGKNLLASYSNVPNSRSGGTLHQVVLSATRFTDKSILKFTGAVISVDTGLPSAKPKFTKFAITNSTATLTPGWVKNGQYMESGEDFSQEATLKFHGSGIAVYGLCTNTLKEFGSTNYGQVETDTTSFPKTIYDTSDTNIFRLRPFKADDCLLYYNTGLAEGDHNLTYTTNRNNVFLSSYQVISVNGSKSGGGQQDDGGGDALKTVGKILGIGIPAVVGIVIGIAALFLICCCWGLCIRRRSKKARVYLPPPAQEVQEPKPLDSAQGSQPIIVLPVATYSPPPPPPPPPQTHLFIVASESHRDPDPEPATTWRPPPGSPEIPNARLRPHNQAFPVARTSEEHQQYTNSFAGASSRASDLSYAASTTGPRSSIGRTMSFGESVPYQTRSALAEAAGIPALSEPQAASPGNRSPIVEHGAYAGRSVLSADGMSYPEGNSSKGRRINHSSPQAESFAVHHADTGPLPDVPPPMYEEARRPPA